MRLIWSVVEFLTGPDAAKGGLVVIHEVHLVHGDDEVGMPTRCR